MEANWEDPDKDMCQVLQVVVQSSGKDNYVFQVHKAHVPLEIFEDLLCQALEGDMGIGQTKGNATELVESSRLTSLMLIQRGHLPVPTGRVQGGKILVNAGEGGNSPCK